jgi:hypothetical protein
MKLCANNPEKDGAKKARAPLFVPIGLVVAGLALLPFDCVYNRVFALMVIGIGAYSLIQRASELYCCLKGRSQLLAANPTAEAPSCY